MAGEASDAVYVAGDDDVSEMSAGSGAVNDCEEWGEVGVGC